MNISTRIFSLSIVLGAVLLSGCSKDNAYDNLTESGGIDFTMQVAKGLTLPFGSSSQIYLTELMDTAAVSQLHADENGQFYLSERGELEETSFFIGEELMSFSQSINKRSFSFMVDQSSLPEEMLQMLTSLNAGDVFSSFGELGITIYRKDISFAGNASFDLHKDDIDPAILTVSKVKPKNPVPITLSVVVSNLPDQNKTLSATSFRLVLPEYVVLENECDPGVCNLQDVVIPDVTTSEMRWSETFMANAMDFSRDSQGALVVENGSIDRPGNFDLIGTVTISNYTCKGSDLYVLIDADGNKIVAMREPVVVEIFPEILVPDVTASELTGTFNPSIDDSNSSVEIELGEDMNFLKEKDAEINLKDPKIVLNINNNSTVGILADLTLLASNNHTALFEGVDLYDASGEKTIVLDSDDVSDGYDLHSFLSPVPDNVEVKVHPYTDLSKDYTIHLEDSVKVKGDYQVIIPYDFNSISISYETRIEDVWGTDVDDITEKLPAITGAELSLTAINTIPLDLKLTISATNRFTGKEESGIVDCDVAEVIKAGSLNNPVSSGLSATLNILDTAKLGDLIFRFLGAGNGCEFNAKQYIQIDNAKISLPEGLNVDFN